MLKTFGLTELEQLVAKVVPEQVRLKRGVGVLGSMAPDGLTESELLTTLKKISSQNKVLLFQSCRRSGGCGYTNVLLPNVIKRNVLENPGWYTQYTPYQPEVAQGRLLSLLNYQTMVKDLTGLPIANASLLDEGTAAAEAMIMCYSTANRKRSKFFVDDAVHPQTLACLRTRAEGFKIEIVLGNWRTVDFEPIKDDLAGVIVQYPNSYGSIDDYTEFAQRVHSYGGLVVAATDLMALTLLKPPGEFGADIAVGSSQRFGVPMAYGGPHAAFFSCREDQRRRLPGRIVGVSRDADGKMALRLSLQTREQHIRREKATSNICTAQVLLANMAALYAVFHGPGVSKRLTGRCDCCCMPQS
ncbi:MAG: glycine cleavage system P-protein [Olpidium bornovanus]|uniref:Glycine cleavage system P protein n=1 Tax=Olpidium bornovanus TaxID=278681 RepID=A0A8H7ZZQ3_9FUNG|nr:MAG: glycine cleavage system P-protein [Olpidium bornovanus]